MHYRNEHLEVYIFLTVMKIMLQKVDGHKNRLHVCKIDFYFSLLNLM